MYNLLQTHNINLTNVQFKLLRTTFLQQSGVYECEQPSA